MKNEAYFIARHQTFSSLINKLPIEREKISPRNLLMAGFIDDSLKDMFEQEFNRILPTIPTSQKLTFAEQTSFNTFFAQYPEKVAGVEKKTTSIQFPLKIVGGKELVIKTIRNGMKTKENTPVKVKSEVAEKTDFDKNFNFYYPKKRETDFVNICLNLGVSEVKKANTNQQNWIYMLYKGFWFLVLDNGGEFKVFRKQDDGDTTREMLGWIYFEEHDSLNSIAKELIDKFEDYFEDNKPKFFSPIQQKIAPAPKYKVGDFVESYQNGKKTMSVVTKVSAYSQENKTYFYDIEFGFDNKIMRGVPEEALQQYKKVIVPNSQRLPFRFEIGNNVTYKYGGDRQFTGEITDRYYGADEPIYRITFPNSDKLVAVKDTEVIGLFVAQETPKFKVGDIIKQNNLNVVEKVLGIENGKYSLKNIKTKELDRQPINLINATYYLQITNKKPSDPEPRFNVNDTVQVTAKYLNEYPAERRGTNRGVIKNMLFLPKDKVWGYDVNFVQDNRMQLVTEKEIELIKPTQEPKFKVGDIVKGKTWDILGTVDAVITESAIRPICYILKNARGSAYAISYFKNSITGQVVVDEADLELRFKENDLSVEKVLWAAKKGEPDWKEEIITNKAETFDDAKRWAAANGFDRFREANISDGQPNFKETVINAPEQPINPKYNIGDRVKITKNSIEGVVLSRRILSGKYRYLLNALKGSLNDLTAYGVNYKDGQKLIFVFETALEPISKLSEDEKTKKLKLLKLKLKLQTQTLLLKQRQ